MFYYIKNRDCWVCHGHKRISNNKELFIKSLNNVPRDENGIAHDMVMCKNCAINLYKWMNKWMSIEEIENE